MADKPAADKIPLVIYVSPDVAQRLMALAAARKRPAAELAAELLDRNLPRTPGAQQGKIPYT